MIKTLIIGAGRMGLRHLQNVLELKYDLVALSDLKQETLESAKEQYKLANEVLVQDWEQAIQEKKPELVIVSTTAPIHAEATIKAFKGGVRYVLCEKPMAISIKECNAMLEAEKKSGGRLAINHGMRYMHQYTRVKELACSEAFGGLSSMTVSAGNFGICMNGCHYFEAFNYLFDEPLVKVRASFSDEVVPNPRGAQFEDRAGSVWGISASGKRYYMDISADQGHGMMVVYGCRNGQIFVDELHGKLYALVRQDEHRDLPTTRYGMPDNTIEEAIIPADSLGPAREVLKALIAGEGYPDGQCGKDALSAVAASYQSDESGGSVIDIAQDLNTEKEFPWA